MSTRIKKRYCRCRKSLTGLNFFQALLSLLLRYCSLLRRSISYQFLELSVSMKISDITQDKNLLTVVSSAVPLLFPCSMLCFIVVVRNIADMLPGNIYYSRWLVDIVYAGRIGFVHIITHKYHTLTNI